MSSTLSATGPPTTDQPPAFIPDPATNTTIVKLTRRQGTPQAGNHCSPVVQQYSAGRWIWGEFQFCINAHPDLTIVWFEVRRAMYYWGGAWYSTKEDHPYHWAAKASTVGSPERKPLIRSGDDWVYMRRIVGYFKPVFRARRYEVRTQYTQTGPFWGGTSFSHDQTYVFDFEAA